MDTITVNISTYRAKHSRCVDWNIQVTGPGLKKQRCLTMECGSNGKLMLNICSGNTNDNNSDDSYLDPFSSDYNYKDPFKAESEDSDHSDESSQEGSDNDSDNKEPVGVIPNEVVDQPTIPISTPPDPPSCLIMAHNFSNLVDGIDSEDDFYLLSDIENE